MGFGKIDFDTVVPTASVPRKSQVSLSLCIPGHFKETPGCPD